MSAKERFTQDFIGEIKRKPKRKKPTKAITQLKQAGGLK